MFARTLAVESIDGTGAAHPCLLRWIDSFAMRNFTNDADFDDTLPLADGRMEAGFRVPLPQLEAAMQHWFRRKGYLKPGERVRISEVPCGQ